MSTDTKPAALLDVAFGIHAAEFLRELDDLLKKYDARIVMQRTFAEHAIQFRFEEFPLKAITVAKARPGRGAGLTYDGGGHDSLGQS